MEEKRTVSPYLSDKAMYGFGFLAGLLWLVLGSTIFILPLLVIGSSDFNMDIMMEKIMMYQGYAASVAEIVGISLAIILFRKVFVSDFKDFVSNWKKNLIIILIASALIFACGYLFEFIYEFFGGEVFNFDLKTAIDRDFLTKYYYYPHTISLTDEEQEKYNELSLKIAQNLKEENGKLIINDFAKKLLYN